MLSERSGEGRSTAQQQQAMSALNLSWVIEHRVAGVASPCSEEDIALLRQQGVKALVSLHEDPLPLDLLARDGIEIVHLPLADYTPPLHQVEQAVASIERFLAAGRPVAVQCAKGRGRTGTILACYLVSQGRSTREAIALLRTMRPGSIETPEQEAVIEAYEQHRKGEATRHRAPHVGPISRQDDSL
jgi:atypical dual specificity phosphatase